MPNLDDSESTDSEVPLASSTVDTLRIRRFRWLWIANAFSQTFWFVYQVASAWLMLELTDSPIWVSLVVASATLPFLAFGLIAGALADTMDKRRVLLAAQSAMGILSLVLAVLWFTDLLGPGLLLTLNLGVGAALAFDRPAWQALIPDLVPEYMVPNAIALSSASNNAAKVIGPAVGGLIVAAFGAGLGFLLNGLSYVAVLAVISRLRKSDWAPDAETSMISAIASGVRYARFTAEFRWLLLTVSTFAFSTAVLVALLPNITQDALGGSSFAYGTLLGLQGLGAVVGAFARQTVSGRLRSLMIPVSIGGFAAATLTLGVAPTLTVAGVATFFAGGFWLWTLTTFQSTFLLLSPPWVRGRIMSLYLTAFFGFVPLGAITSGVLADSMGLREATVTMSFLIAMTAVLAARTPLPVLEGVVSPTPVGQDETVHDVGSASEDPVLIVNTWKIAETDLDAFLETMSELRLIRLRTGATRWELYRAASDPTIMMETMHLSSWRDHLLQHQRLDSDAASVIEASMAFDRSDGPHSRHLLGVSVDHRSRPVWQDLWVDHDTVHAEDGSIPLRAHD